MSEEKDSHTVVGQNTFVLTLTLCTILIGAVCFFILPTRPVWRIDTYVPQASTYAGDIDWLNNLITFLVGFWFLVAEFVLFWFIFKFRRKPGVRAQYIGGDQKEQKKWIAVPHMLIIICDVVLIAGTIFVWHKVKQALPPAEATVRITGAQWAWVCQHPGLDGKLDTDDDVTLVDELHLKADTVYHFELQSRDVLHSFSVPAFRLKQDAVPGRVIKGWFEPIRTGEFDLQCAEMCGIGHGLMVAKVFVKTPEEHQQWLTAAAQPAPAAPASKPAGNFE